MLPSMRLVFHSNQPCLLAIEIHLMFKRGLSGSDYRVPCLAAGSRKTSIKPATPTWGSWIQEVRLCHGKCTAAWPFITVLNSLQHLTTCYVHVSAFGAASMDDNSSRQNGYSQNKHLKEAHKVLDNNLGTAKNCEPLVLFGGFFFFWNMTTNPLIHMTHLVIGWDDPQHIIYKSPNKKSSC